MGFLMFSHLQQTDLSFFVVSPAKNFRKKVAKQKNLTWGRTEIFICDCNIFLFLLQSHKHCFRVPLA